METTFSDSFFKSLKKLKWQQSNTYKFYSLFRYDIPNFFKNVWLFRKNLWNHTWYCGDGSILPWVKTAVDDMAWRIEKHGIEIESSRLKKVAQMKRLSYLIDICVNDKFIELAEEELGELKFYDWDFEPVEGEEDLHQIKDNSTPEEKAHFRSVFSRAREIEKEHWEELCNIIKGPDYDNIVGDFDEWYDGTGIKAWWD